jgi:pimeloyl-ACP methyl ester carboxylesterase
MTVMSLVLLAALSDVPDTLVLRDKPQRLHLYGTRGAPPAVVTSGDGGWVHLGPDVAERLARRGYFVVGFDAKAYLSSFTEHGSTLRPEDVPRDYLDLVAYASRDSTEPPLLVGVSEGAGLSVLAATRPEVQQKVKGVLTLGLPDRNELGWRFRDSVIYLTHKTPDEPLFRVSEIVDRVAPLPLAAVHSTHDEFVPVSEIEDLVSRAGEPKRLWLVDARDHRFSDRLAELDLRLVEAVDWIATARR